MSGAPLHPVMRKIDAYSFPHTDIKDYQPGNANGNRKFTAPAVVGAL
jgi:hypothetical protein